MNVCNALTKAIALRILVRAYRHTFRPCDQPIGGTADDPYMERWHVIPRNNWCNVYLHRFRHSDDDRALHDHPFASLSIGLFGHMREAYKDRRGQEVSRTVGFGHLVYRGGEFAHRLIVPEPGAMTLFVTGPRFRRWGFHCPKGWVDYRDFADPTDTNKIGRGCGEP